MTITPRSMLINDPMPSLGRLVRDAIKPEPCKFKAFETGDHKIAFSEGALKSILRDLIGLEPAPTFTIRWPAPTAHAFFMQHITQKEYEAVYPPVPAVDVPHFKAGDFIFIKAIGRDEDTRRIVEISLSGQVTYTNNGVVQAKARHVSEIEHVAPPATLEGDGWIEWKGGKCPLESYVRISTKSRDSSETWSDVTADTPHRDRWEHDGYGCEIVAYRVVKS